MRTEISAGGGGVITGHIAGPLVALEMELTSGLSDVLGRLLLLHLPQLLLGIFTQEVNSYRGRSQQVRC